MKPKHTYSLLVNSEEKHRSIFETVVYGLVVVSMVSAVFAFASQSVTVPRMPRSNAGPASMVASTPAQPLVAAREAVEPRRASQPVL
jgi:hypothetical protein